MPAPQAAPLPLSGRPPDAGAVTVVRADSAGAGPSEPAAANIQVRGPLSGSISAGSGQPALKMLSLSEAIQRGLEYNLGLVSINQFARQARGQRTISRSALLPNITADLAATLQKLNLEAMGFRFGGSIDGFSLPSVVGPFSYVDFRARVSYNAFDLTSWHNYHASNETARASQLSAEDTRDLVALAVGGAYLQVLAAGARVDSARAQLETANALYRQNVERRAVGLVAQVDTDRSQVQALTQQQRVIALQNDLAKQKINLTRMIGVPPSAQYDLTDRVRFAAAPDLTLDAALALAREGRADLKAAAAQVAAAERALAAARAERMPSLGLNLDVGSIGATPWEARATYSVVGVVRVPIWQGGREAGRIDQAEAALAQRRAELDDLGSAVESEIRQTYLDLEAAASQVDVAQQNLKVTRDVLDLTRQRFAAGITDNVEVVQAQESVAAAEFDYINSVFTHTVSKLNLARGIGQAGERLSDFLTTP
jgi:outer membrane protein TolC